MLDLNFTMDFEGVVAIVWCGGFVGLGGFGINLFCVVICGCSI